MSKTIFLISMTLLTGAVRAVASEAFQFTLSPPASGAMIEILGGAPDVAGVSLPTLYVSGYDQTAAIVSPLCTLRGYRPSEGELNTPVHSEDNTMSCAFVQKGRNETMILSFKEDGLFTRGRHWEDPAIEIVGPSVRKLGLLIQQATRNRPTHPLLGRFDFEGPGENQILSFDVRSRPDGRDANDREDIAPLSVSCVFNSQAGRLDRSFCVFSSVH